MKVAIIGTRWPPETFIRRMISGLAARGVHFHIAVDRRPRDRARTDVNFLIVPSAESALLRRLTWSIIRLVAGCLVTPWRTLRILKHAATTEASFAKKIDSIMRVVQFCALQVDAIYFPWNAAAIAHEALFKLGIPVIISCRGAHVNIAPLNPRRSYMVDGLRRTFLQAAVVHCVSDAIAIEGTRYGLSMDRVRIIRPAVDIDQFQPIPERSSSSGFHLITTGSLIWRKSLEDAIQVVRFLTDAGHDVHLTIIGDGPERQRLVFAMHDMQVAGRVTLAGRQAPESVKARLQSADAFILTSVSEGISNAVLEAMACGLPVVTTDCGGMREAVEDGIEGFVVPARRPDLMADAIAKLILSPETAASIGAAARRRAVNEFNLQGQVDAWMRLLEESQRAA